MKKERPILFSTPMVQAILSGNKTQTRRIIKPQPIIHNEDYWEWKGPRPKARYASGAMAAMGKGVLPSDPDNLFQYDSPYGMKGDVLWVREKFMRLVNCKTGEFQRWSYYADMPEEFHKKYPHRWKPSIHMPKDACRLRLEITNVRVERLQDISEENIIREGLVKDRPVMLSAWGELWEKINGKESWEANPWVWCISFKVINNA